MPQDESEAGCLGKFRYTEAQGEPQFGKDTVTGRSVSKQVCGSMIALIIFQD